MDTRFGLWNVRSLYRADTLMTISRELSKYKLDLVGVQEVRWEGGVKDSFYEELERMVDKFPKYHMKILLGDFNTK
jgi:endonuclease/exonuclease/phosphatase family metal-dependent hydrolase